MENSFYTAPEMEIIEFETEDILTTSGGDKTPWTPDPDEAGIH